MGALLDFFASPANSAALGAVENPGTWPNGRLIITGAEGTGKTHLAIAIARACIRDGARGRFFNVVDLVNNLEAVLSPAVVL